MPLTFTFVAQEGYARLTYNTNIRSQAPTTAAPIAFKALAGSVRPFVGWVTNGEAVSGNAQWFKQTDGNYFWAGSATVVPETAHGVYSPVSATHLVAILSCPFALAQSIEVPLNTAMQEFSINTPLRQAAFIAQTAHESIGYTATKENLNYSAAALTATWPTRFQPEVAAMYARQPEKIANRAYGGRLGNGDEASGDGWRYRGRGIIQITGKSNYRECGAGLGLNLVATPELLEEQSNAFRSGAWFWDSRTLSPLADVGDFLAITKKINGGTNGLADRERYYALAKVALGVV